MATYGSIPLDEMTLDGEPLLNKGHTCVSIKAQDDDFFLRDGYGWDYAIVFPNVPVDAPAAEGLAAKLHGAMANLPSVNLGAPIHTHVLPHLQAARDGITSGISVAHDTITTGITTGITTVLDTTGITNVLDAFRTSNEHLSIEDMCHRIHKSGLELRLFYSSKDESSDIAPYILCQVRASFALLKHEADRIDISRLMDADALRATALAGYPDAHIAPFHIEDTLGQYKLSPYEYIHMTYTERPDMQHLYARDPASGHFFSGVERICLIESILTNANGGGAGLDLAKLEESGTIVASFPLHNTAEKTALYEAWIHRRKMFAQPIDQIAGYFGPKIGLYFAFLGHYASWLVSAGLIGSLIWLLEVLNNVPLYDGFTLSLGAHWLQVLVCGFSVFMVLWSTCMLEYWKRYNARLAMQWGTTDYTEEERPRPQFVGTLVPSPITGKPILYFDRKEQRKRMLQSWLVLLLLVLAVLVLVSFTFYLRYYMAVSHKETFALAMGNNGTRFYYGGTAASLTNVIQIALMAEIYDRVCMRMNDFENHATESAHEGSFILKSIIFHFVNNFAALFYITFIKSSLDDYCENGDCLQELRTTLVIIFGTQLIAGNIQEVLLPRVFIWLARCQAHTSSNTQVHHPVERQFFLNDYGWRGTYNDYLELVLQFGFTVLFVGAFPATPIFSLLNNVLEIRIDAYRLLTDYRRPMPRPVANMGAWITVLDILATIAIATNGYVMVYTSGVFESLEAYDRLLLFLAFFALMLFLRYVIFAFMERNYSMEVRAQLKRQAFLSSKIYTREADDVVPEYAHDANYRFEILDGNLLG
ncbi:hypothetical protein SDRG_13931 [Saprolegnia diclina VS20]|uniref:Anoctamin transmembrane domain-containing protein n=1 Tax=Saprolegnia diclina (strain VS20) TaxID=1156394 RepID=T0PSC2_SAPDV|nr:hypothetical protein SDRG_13931 [Saprolegnia diclina VS20]EQC28384.1 hypothetical protein SDRG_13931 [Saprolegnia diclina VS20]|eukprot:XP_008618254.1 hypothetical protein SDRG_13931 [Saprolegnia diclina VS20]